MRKTYIRITATICALILIVVFLCSFLLTMMLVNKVNGEYIAKGYSVGYPASVYYAPQVFHDPDKVNIIFDTGMMYEDYYPEIGRYRTIKYFKTGIGGDIE